MTALALTILAFLQLAGPGGRTFEIAWCRGWCGPHAARVAAYLEAAAVAHDTDPYLLAALAEGESSYDPKRVGRLGERGLLQLHPKSTWGRAAESTNDCKRGLATCDYIRTYHGAAALADGLATCPTRHAAIGKFKSGRCIEGPIGARILRRARAMRRGGGR